MPEDLGTGTGFPAGDITSEATLGNEEAVASIIACQDAVMAGLEEAVRIFEHEGLAAMPRVKDGQPVREGMKVLTIKGSAKALLRSERLALNFITRMSGIATETRALVVACHSVNPDVKISATRKTTPGFRQYEKKAVELGGGLRHREGLYDQILIKDNHLAIAGSITHAIERARDHLDNTNNQHIKIEVEVTDLPGAQEAARAGPDIIMLDNMTPAQVELTAAEIRKIDPKIKIEISGGITPDNIAEYAKFADVISLGWLTHSAKSADFHLEIEGITSG